MSGQRKSHDKTSKDHLGVNKIIGVTNQVFLVSWICELPSLRMAASDKSVSISCLQHHLSWQDVDIQSGEPPALAVSTSLAIDLWENFPESQSYILVSMLLGQRKTSKTLDNLAHPQMAIQSCH